MKPRTKAPQNEQLGGTLTGDLAAYAAEGLPKRPLSPRTMYRYKGVLLAYEKALQGADPTVKTNVQFLLPCVKTNSVNPPSASIGQH